MARYLFGGAAGDFAIAAPSASRRYLLAAPNVVDGTAWTDRVGGSQLTDLVAVTGADPVSTDADGWVNIFQGPDGVPDLWIDLGVGRRFLLRTTEILSTVFDPAGTAAAAVAAHVAALDPHPQYLLQAEGDALYDPLGAGAAAQAAAATDATTKANAAQAAAATDATTKVNAEAVLARNADNLTSGTVADARVAATIARDSEVTAAITASEAGQVRDGDAAGGVLAGTYPSPSFAVDMATQAELDAETALARNADNLSSGTVADARIAGTIARDSEVTTAVAAEAMLARNADNLTSGTVADVRVASTIARDSEVSAAITASEAGQVRDGDTAGGVLAGTYPNPSFASDMATQAELDAVVVDSIADADTTHAPSRNAVFGALALKAPLASPALTGTPTAPTAAPATNSTQVATTAYADAKVADAINDSTTTVAPSQNAVFDALALKAPLASPALTGSPTTPTQSASDNSTKIASTAYVDTAAGLLVPKSLADAKGDLFVATADNTVGRLAVGSNEQALVADSAQTAGVRWSARMVPWAVEVLTSQGVVVPAGVTKVEIVTVAGGAGGTGGGSATAVTTQVGGPGGGAGGWAAGVFAVTPGDTLTCTIGAGGSGGAGGAANGNAGTQGGFGGTTSVTGTGVSISAYGGSKSAISGANSAATAAGGVPGEQFSASNVTTLLPGVAGFSSASVGATPGGPCGYQPPGGQGGGPANATNGGLGGGASGRYTTATASVGAGGSGTAAGGNGTAPAANTGAGGSGGGGGAPVTGAGGNGTAGGSGYVVIKAVG